MSASEALGAGSQMQTTLDAGIGIISSNATVTFTQYTKTTVSNDGSVYWVANPGTTVTVSGSLHYATDRVQDEDQTIGATHVILTSEEVITEFSAVNPQAMWIGSWPNDAGGSLQVVFGRRQNYYQEANIWHYNGYAVYPALETQLVSTAADIPAGPIVTNSLPIWLTLNSYTDGSGTSTTVPVYPSYLVPDNISPPYVVAHIRSTTPVGGYPLDSPWSTGVEVPNSGASPLYTLGQFSLMRDDVELTLYGFTALAALQYMQTIISSTIVDGAPFGLANIPALQDSKRIQAEIATIAQKKTVVFQANYYMGAADVIARRLILSVLNPTITILDPGAS